jgi:hypothetical protein
MRLFHVIVLYLLVALPIAVAMADDETVPPPSPRTPSTTQI